MGLGVTYGQKETINRSSFLHSTLRVKTKHLLNDNWEDNTNLSTAAAFPALQQSSDGIHLTFLCLHLLIRKKNSTCFTGIV